LVLSIGASARVKYDSPLLAKDYCFFFLAAARGFAAGGVSAGAGGWSPSIVLSGQILKAGHFWQPATMAIGQMVIEIPPGESA